MMPRPRNDVRFFRALASHLHTAPDCTDIAIEEGNTVGAALWDAPGHAITGRDALGLLLA